MANYTQYGQLWLSMNGGGGGSRTQYTNITKSLKTAI